MNIKNTFYATGLILLFVVVFLPLTYYFHYMTYNMPIADAWGETVRGAMHFVFPAYHSVSRYLMHLVLYLQSVHVDHRLVLTRIIYLLDYYFFSGSRYPLLLLAMVMQLFTFFLIVRSVSEDVFARRWQMLCFIILLATAFFNGGQHIIWTYSFTIQQPMTIVFGTCAILTICNKKNKPRTLWAAVVFSVLATLSSANGLLIWFVLLFGLAIQAEKRVFIKPYAIFAAVVIGLYFVNFFHSAYVASKGQPLWHYFLYFVAFMGGAFQYLGDSFAWAMGLVCLTVLLLIYVQLLMSFRQPNYRMGNANQANILLFFVLLSMISLGSAVMAMAGRILPGAFHQAFASRFMPFQTLVAICALVLCLFLIKKAQRLVSRGAAVLAFSVLAIGIVVSYGCSLYIMVVEPYTTDAAMVSTAALENNIFPLQQSSLYPYGNSFVLATLAKARDLQLFGLGKGGFINHNVKQLAITLNRPLVSQPLLGIVVHQIDVKQGWYNKVLAMGFIPGYQTPLVVLPNSFNRYQQALIVHNGIVVGMGMRLQHFKLGSHHGRWAFYWRKLSVGEQSQVLVCFRRMADVHQLDCLRQLTFI